MNNRWINVKDRKPEDRQQCLCVVKSFIDNRYLQLLTYAADLYEYNQWDFLSCKGKDGFVFYDSEYGDGTLEVEYWMPLPELPKE